MIERPKRRRYKDNPYYIIETDKNNYYVSFIDGLNNKKIINVNKEIYEEFNKFELDDLKELNDIDNHRDFKYCENIDEEQVYIYMKSINKNKSLEKIVEEKILYDELKVALNNLNEIQKDRIKKYFFDNMTLREIADKEGCSPRAVKYSIDHAIDNLKKYFNV